MKVLQTNNKKSVDVENIGWGDCFLSGGLPYMAIDVSCFHDKKVKLFVNLNTGVVEDFCGGTKVYPVDVEARIK